MRNFSWLLPLTFFGFLGPTATAGSVRSHRSAQFHVPPFAAPPAFAAFGPELSRATIAVLEAANIDASASLGDPRSTFQGRMNVISPTNEVHLNVNLGGASVQVAGDMEHLDDLVHEVVEKLRPTLGVTDATTYSFLVAHSPSKKGSLRLPAPSGSRDADRASEALETPRESVDAGPPHVDSGPTLMPTVGVLSSVEDSAVDRVRIAVNIVGEPIDQGQSGFYGIGVAAQQSIIKYLQERLHLAAVPTRLVGLVSGLEALSYSLMFRAHYTLMARFDALTITGGTPAGYAMLSLTGRVHIVLLRDGKQLLDRSLMIPVTPFGPAEPPNRVAVRAITATMETIASDLRERLAGAH